MLCLSRVKPVPRLCPLVVAFVLLSFCLSFDRCSASEVRISFPAAYADDAFINSLLSSKVLAEAGLKLIPQKLGAEPEAMQALKTGATDLGVFTLTDADFRAVEQGGSERSLLTRPFMFKSAAEVFLMQRSFIGDAAASAASRSGLFPLNLWNHAITYLLTEQPIQTAADFDRLTIAARNGSPDALFHVLGAKTLGAMPSEPGAMNALQTHCGIEAHEFATRYGGKLYLTTGWPETGLLAATPGFWLKLSEAEKNALQTAAEQAREAVDAEIMAREDNVLRVPNIERNQLGFAEQMQLALRAGEGGQSALDAEIGLWRKAEAEAQGQTAKGQPAAPPSPAESPAPARKTGTNPPGAVCDRPR